MEENQLLKSLKHRACTKKKFIATLDQNIFMVLSDRGFAVIF
jgi:hypothetical protein